VQDSLVSCTQSDRAVTVKKNAVSILLMLLFSFLAGTAPAQPVDYARLFAGDWEKAKAFLNENDTWIKASMSKYNLPYDETVAIVFPELVRYSAIRDKMEITLLKSLYRNLGEDYADFSVGVFQVKPSFAERIRLVSAASGKPLKSMFRRRSGFSSDHEYRSAIISDLESPEAEFRYIIAFCIICSKQFNLGKTDASEKIRFLATAYNTGFWKSEADIKKMEEKKYFTTKLFKSETYPYADVALFWYENH